MVWIPSWLTVLHKLIFVSIVIKIAKMTVVSSLHQQFCPADRRLKCIDSALPISKVPWVKPPPLFSDPRKQGGGLIGKSMKSQKKSAPSARIWTILVCFWRFLKRKRLFLRSERQNFRACGANSCSWSDLKSLDNKHKVKSDRTAHKKSWRVSSMWNGSVFVKKRRRRENF